MIQKFINKYKNLSQPVKASLWFAICGFIQKGINFFTTPIFSRLLTTEEYGKVSVFLTWNSIIIIIATLNLSAGVYLRGLVKYSEDEKNFTASIQSLFVISEIITLLLYLIFSPLINKWINLGTPFMIALFVDIAATTAFQFWSSRQRVQYLYRNLVIITIVNAIVKPLLSIISIIIFKDNVSARIYSIVLADFITFFYFILIIFINKPFASKKYWKYALKYNIPLVPHYLSQIILNQADRLMIDSIVGTSEAGIYSLAYSTAAILIVVNQSLLNTYNPWFYQKLKKCEYNNIGSISYKLLLLVGSLNLFLIAFAPEAIAFMAPTSYYSAIWIIPPVAMGSFYMFLYSLFANFEFYFEKTKIMMIASVSGAILNLILNQIFITKYGFLAAGYTTLICYIFYCVAHYIVMVIILRKNLPNIKLLNMKLIIPTSILFMFIGFGLMALYNYRLIRFSIVIVALVILLFMRNKLKSLIQDVRNLKTKS